MPHYTIVFRAGADGVGRRIEVDTPNAWLAIERMKDRIGAFGAELWEGTRLLGIVNRVRSGREDVWEFAPA